MDKNEDGVLFLLQDIKTILFGIALIFLILLGGILTLAPCNDEYPVWIAGIFALIYGGFYGWNGGNTHKRIERNSEPQKQKEQGGPHAL